MDKTLVDTHTLALHLHDPQWVIIDCRFTLSDPEAGRRAYDTAHIQGARYADLNRDLSSPVTAATGRHPLPDVARLSAKLGEWGIDSSTQVVVYDDNFGAMAARLWWLLRWLGHDAVALLDGGLPRWQREKHPMTADKPAVTAKTFVAKPRDNFWVDAAVVTAAVKDDRQLVIDARAEERFNGEIEPLDKVAGHIPGAVNMPFEDNLHLSGLFLKPEELRSHYEGMLDGVDPKQVIVMCGSGVTACHNLLAMAHAGLQGARLYVGSWSEWINDPSRPVKRDV
jgi:thiosulfate/3-mercaptopyruvate sulfurtransferase